MVLGVGFRSPDHARSPDHPILLLSELFKERDYRLNPTIEVGDVELFVGRVQVVIGQAEAHHYAWDFEYVLKVCHDRNRPAGADKDRIFLKDLMQRLRCGLDEWVICTNHAGRAFAEDLDIGFNSFGRELLYELSVFL